MDKEIDFQIQFGFSEGLKALKKAKEAGFSIIEYDDRFEWEQGFVKKDFLKDEEAITNQFFLKILNG